MFQSLLWLLLLIYSGFSQQTCDFQHDDVIQYDSAVNCLNSIPITSDKKEQNEVFEILNSYAALNVFGDALLSPSEPFKPLAIDLVSEINKLSTQNFSNTNELYQNISQLFMRLKDPHSTFHKACNSLFTFILPYNLRAVLDSSNQSKVVLQLSKLPPQFKYVNDFYKRLPGFQEIENGTILAINITGGPTGGDDPAQLLMNWADENIYYSKTSPARFNKAIQSDFSIRNQSVYNMPVNKAINLTLLVPDKESYQSTQCEKDCQQKEINQIKKDKQIQVELPWYAIVKETVKSLNEKCPVDYSYLDENEQDIEEKEEEINSKQIKKLFYSSYDSWKRMADDLQIQQPYVEREEEEQTNPDPLVELLVNSTHVRLYYYKNLSIGLLRIKSFAPGNGISDIENEINQDIAKNEQNIQVSNLRQSNPHYDVGSAPGGSVRDSDWIHQFRKDSARRKWKYLPNPFPRMGTLIRFPFEEIYSTKQKERNIPLEFKINSPDKIIQYFSSFIEEDEYQIQSVIDIIGKVGSYFRSCFDWEYDQGNTCIPKHKQKHTEYGRKCDVSTQKFDGVCDVSKCATNYFLHPDSLKCTLIPKPHKSLLSTKAIITILIFVIIALTTIICIIGCLYIYIRKRNRRGSSEYSSIGGQGGDYQSNYAQIGSGSYYQSGGGGYQSNI
ncbi:MAG: hypothetical protein EZS28_004565 [Streblomastix strix]|uniref:MACPF domain-containing protein n=1 Tax=Streblomastix strix TaxID=222440 RepID=A0A5J4WXU6_9EUKA|nr:MAG: hypothetical protein EZS28_004565 [Streblomastix strix]